MKGYAPASGGSAAEPKAGSYQTPPAPAQLGEDDFGGFFQPSDADPEPADDAVGGSAESSMMLAPEPEQEHARFDGEWVPHWRRQRQQWEAEAALASTGAGGHEAQRRWRDERIAGLSYALVLNPDDSQAGSSIYDPQQAEQLAAANAWEQRVALEIDERLREAQDEEEAAMVSAVSSLPTTPAFHLLLCLPSLSAADAACVLRAANARPRGPAGRALVVATPAPRGALADSAARFAPPHASRPAARACRSQHRYGRLGRAAGRTTCLSRVDTTSSAPSRAPF